MIRPLRALAQATVATTLLLAASVGAAQAQSPGPQPFAPEWGMFAGGSVFAEKGCGKCHAVRGGGGKGGPDLARSASTGNFFDIGAAMWNHLPRMGAKMREAGIERPRLTAGDVGYLTAFIYTMQYFDESGDARQGEALFTSKGCVGCHAVGGRGGSIPLDWMKRANSPVMVAAAMWNHAPAMQDALKRTGTARPTLSGKDLLDIIAYLSSASTDVGPAQQVVPGTPGRGRAVFVERRCAECHAVGGVGVDGKVPKVGPDLGRAGHHISLTELGARMWNHAPGMMAKMQERNVEIPRLTGQDMADVLAYLYSSRYFDATPNARRGSELLQAKGCAGCHAVAGKGARVGGDLAASRAATSRTALIAGMWNHAWMMEAQIEKRQVAWPELRGDELADISAYLSSLRSGTGSKPASR